MKVVSAGLGLVWAAGSVLTGVLFVLNGLAAKTAAKGLFDQALLVLGGLLLLTLALMLAWQCAQLVRAASDGDASA